MVLDTVKPEWQIDIVSGVIQLSQHSPNDQEGDGGDNMAWNNVHRNQVQVFSCEELERMNVYGIRVAPAWSLLLVVVLVDQRVHRSVMESHVEIAIEKVVDNKERNKRKDCVLERQLCHIPFDMA